MTARILVLGASGFIGHRLMSFWPECAIGTHFNNPRPGTLFFDPLTMQIKDIAGVQECSHAIFLYGEREPDICWSRPSYTRRLNVESSTRLIGECVELGIVPIFASTEMVFSGNQGLYKESDKTGPLLLYGLYKQKVESFIRQITDDYLILRLAKVIGTTKTDGSLFSNWLTVIENDNVEVVRCASDQFFSIISVDDLLHCIDGLVNASATGTFHISDGARYCRIELLECLLSSLKLGTENCIHVVPVSINDFGLPEKRPIDLSLLSEKLSSLVDIKFTSPEDCINLLLGSCINDF